MKEQLFFKRFFQNAVSEIETISQSKVGQICNRIVKAYCRESKIFIAGNGGSASIAEHFTCDLSKTTWAHNKFNKKRLRVYSLVSNTALLTAWANDEGYSEIFAQQLRNLGDPGDELIVISSSGNSPNIIKAIETAKEMNIFTTAFVGFSGGKAAQLADAAIHIPRSDYGIVESLHSLLTHAITAWVSQSIKSLDTDTVLAEVA